MNNKKPTFVKYPEVIDRIVESVQIGVPLHHAARAGGIQQWTFDRWRRAGKEIESKIDSDEVVEEMLDEVDQGYLKFYRNVEDALQMLMRNNLVKIQVAGESSWQANAWILERRFPKFFGQTSRIKLDTSTAQSMLEMVVKEVLPFVPEEKHAELADRLEQLQAKLAKDDLSE